MTLACTGIGIGVSRAVALGPAYVLRRGPIEVTPRWIEEHEIEAEIERFRDAIATARGELQAVRDDLPELDRDPLTQRFADWRETIYPDPVAGLADVSPSGRWLNWMASYPQTGGVPGDPPKARRRRLRRRGTQRHPRASPQTLAAYRCAGPTGDIILSTANK